MNAKPIKKQSARRRLLRIALYLVAITLIAFALQAIVLPRIIRARVVDALAALGMPDASFELRDASLWGTEVDRIEGGRGLLKVESVQLDYGPSIVSTGRLKAIRLRGAELRLAIHNNQLDLSGLTPTSNASSSGTGDVPFDRLELESSTLRLDWDQRAWWLPISGEIVNDSKAGGGQLELTFHTFAHGSPIEIIATIPRGGASAAGDVTLAVDAPVLNLASLSSSIPAALLPESIHLGGQAALHLNYQRQQGKQSADMTLSPRQTWVQSVDPRTGVLSASQIDGSLHVALDDKFLPQSVTADLRGQRLYTAGQLLTHISFKASTTKETVNATLAASGDGWRLNGLDIDIGGILGRAVPSNIEAKSHYDLSGQPPREVMDALLKRGVAAKELGELSIIGDAVAAVNLTGAATTMPSPATKPADLWRIRSSKTQITLKPGKLNLAAGGGANVDGLAGVLEVDAAVTPAGASVSLHEGSWLNMQSMRAGAVSADGKTPSISATSMHLQLHPDRELPLLRGRFDAAGWRIDAAFGASTDAPTAVLLPDARFDTGRLILGARMNASSDAAAVLNADAIVMDAKVTQPASGLTLDKINASIPVVWNGPDREMQKLSIGAISVGKESYPPMTGASRIKDGKVELDLSWPILPEATMQAHGTLAAGSSGIDADVRANLPGFTIKDPAELAKRIPALAGSDITGTFAADASVTVRGGLVAPHAGISISDGHIENKSHQLVIDGISGGIQVSSFSPLQTEGRQTLKIKSLTKGDLKMIDGTIALRVERPDSILIESTDWGWAGGRIFSNAFRINPARPNVDIMIFADGLNVGSILDEFAKGKATGAGEVYGRIPVSIRWPSISFGQGYLYSRPGVAGELSFVDTQAVETMLAQSDPRMSSAGQLAQVKDRIVGAMRDFQYDSFRVDLVNDPKGLVAKIDVHGQGKKGPKPQELFLTFNVRGFEALLNTYLGLEEKLSNVKLKGK